MQQTELIQQLGISNSYFRKWRGCLGIEPKSDYPENEVILFLQVKQLVEEGKKLPEAIAQITGKRPEPKQAPGRYSNMPSELQPKVVAMALVQQFDRSVMDEFFRLLHQPLSRQEVSNFMGQLLPEDTVLDAYLLEGGD